MNIEVSRKRKEQPSNDFVEVLQFLRLIPLVSSPCLLLARVVIHIEICSINRKHNPGKEPMLILEISRRSEPLLLLYRL